MAMPTLSFTGEGLYEDIDPLVRDGQDAATDYTAAKLVDAVATMFDTVADLTRDREDGTRGWSPLLDPYACPSALLPFLAQWEGVAIPPGTDEAETRRLIDEAPAQSRGTPWSIQDFLKRYLTGTQHVELYERYGGDASVLAVRTLTSETANAALLLDALVKFQKPAGLKIDFATVTGATYGTMEGTYATYGAAEAAFATYGLAEAG